MTHHIPIVHNHTDFIVINKPCGVHMHDPVNGICQLLAAQLVLDKLYLVHRLDAPTSGCLMLAKTKQAAAILSALFANKEIEKHYIAISDTKPKKKQGKISGDMKKSRGGSYMLSKNDSTHSSAVTFFISQALAPIGRLYIIKPITGKTHQIRVALKSLGSAILGDERYKGSAADRLYLHSLQLAFSYKDSEFCIHCLPQSGEHFSADTLSQLPDLSTLQWPKYTSPTRPLSHQQKSDDSK